MSTNDNGDDCVIEKEMIVVMIVLLRKKSKVKKLRAANLSNVKCAVRFIKKNADTQTICELVDKMKQRSTRESNLAWNCPILSKFTYYCFKIMQSEVRHNSIETKSI